MTMCSNPPIFLFISFLSFSSFSLHWSLPLPFTAFQVSFLTTRVLTLPLLLAAASSLGSIPSGPATATNANFKMSGFFLVVQTLLS